MWFQVVSTKAGFAVQNTKSFVIVSVHDDENTAQTIATALNTKTVKVNKISMNAANELKRTGFTVIVK